MKRTDETEDGRDYGPFIAGLGLLVSGALLGVLAMLAREPAQPAPVVISCPVGTVQIARIDGVWSCIQEGEAA